MFEHRKGREGLNGKVKNVLGIKEIYRDYKLDKKYKERIKVKNIIDYNTFKNILFDCNKEISRILLDDADEFKLPLGLGVIGIYKFKRKFNDDKPNKWPIDWEESMKVGEKRLHTDLFFYKFKWLKKGRGIRNYRIYKFLATRTNTRRIKKNKDKGLDYFYYNIAWNDY